MLYADLKFLLAAQQQNKKYGKEKYGKKRCASEFCNDLDEFLFHVFAPFRKNRFLVVCTDLEGFKQKETKKWS